MYLQLLIFHYIILKERKKNLYTSIFSVRFFDLTDSFFAHTKKFWLTLFMQSSASG